MTPSELVVTKQPNGRIDLLATIRTLWPILIAVAVFAAWSTERLEDGTEKQHRINTSIAPLSVLIDGNGQAITELKQANLRHETKLDRIDRNVSELVGRWSGERMP